MFGPSISPDQFDALKGDDKNRQVADDAGILKQHGEIVGHPPRHAAALEHLQQEHQNTQAAIAHASRHLRGKVKDGLQKSFPKESPIQKAKNPRDTQPTVGAD